MQPDPYTELAQGGGQIVKAGTPFRAAPTLRGMLQINAVRARILGDHQDFLDAGAHELFGLAQHLADRPAHQSPSERGNDAKAAAVIAALGDLEIGVMAGRQFHPLRREEIQKGLMLRRQMFVHRRDDFFVALRAGDLEHLRVPIENLLRLRSQAARHDDLTVLGQRFANRVAAIRPPRHR